MHNYFTEKQLKEGFFDFAPSGIATVDREGVFMDVNDELCTILGYTRAELSGRSFQSITHPEDLEADLEMVKSCLSGDISFYRMIKKYIRKDEKIVSVEIFVRAIRDEKTRDFQFFLVHIVALPNHGKFKVEENGGSYVVRPSLRIMEIVKDNPKESTILAIILLYLLAGGTAQGMLDFLAGILARYVSPAATPGGS